MRVQYPLVVRTTLMKVDGETGEVLSRRRSPKRGNVWHLFDGLVRATAILALPGLVFEILSVEVTEYRRAEKVPVRRGRFARSVTTVDRSLDVVHGSLQLREESQQGAEAGGQLRTEAQEEEGLVQGVADTTVACEDPGEGPQGGVRGRGRGARSGGEIQEHGQVEHRLPHTPGEVGPYGIQVAGAVGGIVQRQGGNEGKGGFAGICRRGPDLHRAMEVGRGVGRGIPGDGEEGEVVVGVADSNVETDRGAVGRAGAFGIVQMDPEQLA